MLTGRLEYSREPKMAQESRVEHTWYRHYVEYATFVLYLGSIHIGLFIFDDELFHRQQLVYCNYYC